MRALVFTGPMSLELVTSEPPTLHPDDDALVAPSYVGLCGTDLELFTGSMPYFAEGAAAYPIRPGHEVTGRVVVPGRSKLSPGADVLIDPVAGCGDCDACAAGFQTRCSARRELGLRNQMPGGACELIAVPSGNLFPVPKGLALRDATLAEPGVTALNAVNRLGDVEGRRALVVGAGTVGLIAAQLLRSRQANVEVLVVERLREELVESLGLTPTRCVASGSFPFVVEAAGAPQAVRDAIRAVAPGGRVMLAGVQPTPVDRFEVNEIVLKDATLQGVLNGPGLYQSMLDELAAGSVTAEALIESEYPLEEAADALAALQVSARRAPKVLLRVNC